MSLYPDYRPRGVRKDWEHTAMECVSSAGVLRKYGTPPDWGDPVDVVAWFANDERGSLRAMVADFANGRRVTLRCRKHDHEIGFSTPAKEMAA